MNTSSALEFRNRDAFTLSFRSLLLDEIGSLLLPFFKRMTFDERRARFGGGVSDDAIARYCGDLEKQGASVVACVTRNALVAAVELHAIPTCPRRGELAVASTATNDRIMIYGHLLQLAAFVAGRRGYDSLTIPAEFLEQEVVALVCGMGSVALRDDTLFVDLGEYVRLHVQGS